MNIIGANIKRLRIKFHWTQKELAARCNLTAQQVYNLEKGNHQPTQFTLNNLAIAFQCDPIRITTVQRTCAEIENELLTLNLIKPYDRT